MADLKSGTTVGGSNIWHQSNLPLQPTGDQIAFKGFKIYTSADKPTPLELGALALTGGTLTGNVDTNSQINFGNSTQSIPDITQLSNSASAAANQLRRFRSHNAGLIWSEQVSNSAYSLGVGTKQAINLDVNTNKASFSGELISYNSNGNGFRVVDLVTNKGSFIRNDGTRTYFLVTNANDPLGSYNSLRPFSFDMSTGLVFLDNGFTTNALSTFNSNVTFNAPVTLQDRISSPAVNLDVNGGVIANAYAIAAYNGASGVVQMTGRLSINQTITGEMIRFNADLNRSGYLLALNGGVNDWYIGRGSNSNRSISWNSYQNNNGVTLEQSGNISLKVGTNGWIGTNGYYFSDIGFRSNLGEFLLDNSSGSITIASTSKADNRIPFIQFSGNGTSKANTFWVGPENGVTGSALTKYGMFSNVSFGSMVALNSDGGVTLRTSGTVSEITCAPTGIIYLNSPNHVQVNSVLAVRGSSIELGTVDTVSTPALDFHSSNTGNDYDARIIASGGSATVGQGSLSLIAAGGVTVSNNLTAVNLTTTQNVIANGVLRAGGTGGATYQADGNIAGSAWGSSGLKSYVDNKVNNQNESGLYIKAHASLAWYGHEEMVFKSIDANTLEFTYNIGWRTQRLVVGKTRAMLLKQAVAPIPGNPSANYIPIEGNGLFTVVYASTPDNSTVNTVRISYPNHGIAVGQTKIFRLCGFIYEMSGMTWSGNIQDQGWAQFFTLDTPRTTQNAPIISSPGYLDMYWDVRFNPNGKGTLPNDLTMVASKTYTIDNSRFAFVGVGYNGTIYKSDGVSILVYDYR
ncbi:hypothetical protein POP12_135 [Pectobacterium phage POP12]|nr:hypothetical protein POP12_135 [Pectobacterium phage POP12]